jgi:hypothetical protein
VLHYDVAETAVLSGDIEGTETAEYRCVEVRDAVRCHGVAVTTGTVLGQQGTFRTIVTVTCDVSDPAFPCVGRGVSKGVDGQLADLRATTTASGAGGVSTLDVRVTRI